MEQANTAQYVDYQLKEVPTTGTQPNTLTSIEIIDLLPVGDNGEQTIQGDQLNDNLVKTASPGHAEVRCVDY